MGKTGNLREYLSDITRTISSTKGNGGGGESKDVFDAFKSYVTNTDNIDSISLMDSNGTTDTIPYTSIIDNTIQEDTFEGLNIVIINYKNGKDLTFYNDSDVNGFELWAKNGSSWGIVLLAEDNFVLRCFDNTTELWSIYIIVGGVPFIY